MGCVKKARFYGWAALALLALAWGCAPKQPAGTKPPAAASSPFAAVWANDGTAKTFQEDRPVHDGAPARNHKWDGSKITLAGARNEVVAFNLMLEGADAATVRDVAVSFERLTGPGGYRLESRKVSGDGVFDYVDREIELFYVQYVEWEGLSTTGYAETGGETIRPAPFRLDPASGTRPNWHKHIPEIAIPIELVPRFDVSAGEHQAVWCDVYIPRDAPPGAYSGTVAVTVGGRVTHRIPVALTVRDLALPDEFNVKTVVFIDGGEIKNRFGGSYYWEPDRDAEFLEIVNNIRKLAQRHRITLSENLGFKTLQYFDGNVYGESEKSPNLDPVQGRAGWEADMNTLYLPYFSGEVFDRPHGYEGPGSGRGSDFFSIFPYFSAPTRALEPEDVNGPDGSGELYPATKRFLVDWAPNWNAWFANHAPDVDYSYYLPDEDLRTIAWDDDLAARLDALPSAAGEKKMKVFKTAPVLAYMWKGAGGRYDYRAEYGEYEVLLTGEDGSEWVRLNLPANFPHVDVWAQPFGFTMEPRDRWQDAWNAARGGAGDHELITYNGQRPSTPAFVTDAHGLDLRALEWMRWKFGLTARHFYFMGNLWWNFFGGEGQRYLNFWERAHTHGMRSESFDPVKGVAGWNFSNGDGVLFYPGSDHYYPEHSYGLHGVFASLRLKFWRRGVQDAEYLRLAAAADPERTRRVLLRVVPAGLWETPSAAPDDDPTWYDDPTFPGFSEDPEVYARALEELYRIAKGR